MTLVIENKRSDESIISRVYKEQIDTLYIEHTAKPLDDTIVITKALAPDYRIVIETVYDEVKTGDDKDNERELFSVNMSRIFRYKDTERANIHYGHKTRNGELPMMVICGNRTSIRLFGDVLSLLKVRVGSMLYEDPDGLWNEYILIGE